ncbi:MAG: hypothetical protein BWX47_00316 [candidate division Hyd24-12 bacterium ADurb.Bin004]|nr:MAG: hypothetical protein BWX47_00316 [candidate division Hyd24-12 bacterium ADurb.Bin004]
MISAPAFLLTSPVFPDGTRMPRRYTADGADLCGAVR